MQIADRTVSVRSTAMLGNEIFIYVSAISTATCTKEELPSTGGNVYSLFYFLSSNNDLYK